jgi:hypothetical protein
MLSAHVADCGDNLRWDGRINTISSRTRWRGNQAIKMNALVISFRARKELNLHCDCDGESSVVLNLIKLTFLVPAASGVAPPLFSDQQYAGPPQVSFLPSRTGGKVSPDDATFAAP